MASYGLVTPAGEHSGGKGNDATRLTFPLQLVIVIVGGVLGTTGAFWVSTAQMRSDVRDLLTRQQDQARVEELQQKLQEERNSQLHDAIQEIKAALKLEEIRNQEMRVTVAGITSTEGKRR